MEAAEVLGPIVPVSPCDPLLNQENLESDFRIIVETITGTRTAVPVSAFLSVSCLKTVLAKRFSLPPEKITLLHKDCVLSNGTLASNGVQDLSHVRILPCMETGMKNKQFDKIGAPTEAPVNSNVSSEQDLFKVVEVKQFEDFLSGTVSLTVAVKTENHTLLIQLKINSAVAGPYQPQHNDGVTNHCNKSGTIVDHLEQIAPGVVQGAFSGTIPLCSSPHSGLSYVPVETVQEIVRDLVTCSSKAIGVPEQQKPSISCCHFTTSSSTRHSSSSPLMDTLMQQDEPPLSPTGSSCSSSSSSTTSHHHHHRRSNCIRRVSANTTRKTRHHQQDRVSKRLSTSSSSTRATSNGNKQQNSSKQQQEKYNEVTRMKMSLLRAMLSK